MTYQQLLEKADTWYRDNYGDIPKDVLDKYYKLQDEVSGKRWSELTKEESKFRLRQLQWATGMDKYKDKWSRLFDALYFRRNDEWHSRNK